MLKERMFGLNGSEGTFYVEIDPDRLVTRANAPQETTERTSKKCTGISTRPRLTRT